jgi:hypothetical protein
MTIIPWETPIFASGIRSNILIEIAYSANGLILLIDDEEDKKWRIKFSSIRNFRVLDEECSSSSFRFPAPGGFFEVIDSTWIQELNRSNVPHMENMRQYIISCYDETIEIMSSSKDIDFFPL